MQCNFESFVYPTEGLGENIYEFKLHINAREGEYPSRRGPGRVGP